MLTVDRISPLPSREGRALVCALLLLALQPGTVEAQAALPVMGARADLRADPDCHLTKIVEVPMEFVQNHYVVNALLNGRPAKVMVDTGAMSSGLLFSAIEALGLSHDVDTSLVLSGAGGKIPAQFPAIVHSFKVGGIDFQDVSTPGLPMLATDAAAGPVGLMGANLLSRYDVEFNFPNSTMALWSAQGCKSLLVPWQGRITAFRAHRIRGNAFVIPVVLNGHVVQALLDTGSDASMLAREAALAAGVTPEALEADRPGARYGVSGKVMKSHLHHFETLRIGPEIFRDAGVIVADDMKSDDVDMLLGLDFMRRRRIWVSYTTDEVFIQALPAATTPGNVPPPAAAPHMASEPVVQIMRHDGAVAPTPTPASAPASGLPNRRAMPIGNPASWLTSERYPSAALRMGEQGVVGFGLTIDHNGQVIGCNITRSSGSPSLNAGTCAIMMMHGQFSPATDADGKPTVGTYTSSVHWTMPPDKQVAVAPAMRPPAP